MDAVPSETETRANPHSQNGTNRQSAANGMPPRQFPPGLGDHPLWQDFMNELKAQREADIAESNRLADLELEDVKQK